MPAGYFFIKSLPIDRKVAAEQFAIAENPYNAPGAEAIGDITRYWQPGRTLQIAFMGGSSSSRAAVQRYARGWCDYANIRFDFSHSVQPDIRISFQPSGCWSYIGTDASKAPAIEATMNVDPEEFFQDEKRTAGVILHEFGHALGLLHEHQSPASGIRWDEKAVLADCQKWGWSFDEVQNNILSRYCAGYPTQFSTFDPKSIMIYPIPGHWTSNGYSVSANCDLSQTDKDFIAKVYHF